MGQRVETEDRQGRTIYHLRDDDTGARASILPSYGFNLFDLRLPAAGEVRPILEAAEDWADAPRNPGRNGTPVLFPFPNRIRDGRFTFQGKSYQIPVGNAPNAIHGFAIDAPWEVVRHGVDDDGASIVGRFQLSRHAPSRLSAWPTDAEIQMKYALKGRRLTLEVLVSNPTANDLPWGFGIHPYFRLPFPPGRDLDRTLIVLPARQAWVLDQFLPTGERRPVDSRLDFRQGQPIRGLKLDDVLTDLVHEGEVGTCRLIDQALGAEFRLGFDRTIRELVVFTPPSTEGVISIEPYTQTTDAINLASAGIDGGLRVLKHGQSHRFTLTMQTLG
jgi:aldose 1-epimerase